MAAFEPSSTVSELAERLSVSEDAVRLTRDHEVIDLHLDTFIVVRLVGYELDKRHDGNFMRGVAFGHLDLPRASDAGLSGGMWSITTNPFRTAAGRWRTFQDNLVRMRGLIDDSAGQLAMVRNRAEYDAARTAGSHACLLSVQGGNCFDEGHVREITDDAIVRVTVVHLTNSALGTASTPFSHLRRNKGLTEKGRELVEALDAQRIFVDLAHVHPDGFWDAVEIHDKSLPLIDTHTGVAGVTPHWRNLDDAQIKAIADSGGTIGIIYSRHFLDGKHGHKDGRMILEHMQHIIDVAGDDFVSIGSDYDGAIVPPKGLESGDSYPRLVQLMLDRGWDDVRIAKILGGNFLRALSMLRPD